MPSARQSTNKRPRLCLRLYIAGSFRGEAAGRFPGYQCIQKSIGLPNRFIHGAELAINRVSDLHRRPEKGE
jgi:hypothetical protein